MRRVPMDSQTERLDSGEWLVTLDGDLDLAAVPGLERTLEPLERQRDSHVMLDVHRVDFVDSSAMGAFVRASRRLHQRGGSLSIVRPQRQPSRYLERTGLDRLVPIFASVAEALDETARYRAERWGPDRAVAAHRAAEQLSRAAADLHDEGARSALESGSAAAAEAARERAEREAGRDDDEPETS